MKSLTQNWPSVVSILLSVIILADFLIPGQLFIEPIQEVEQKKQPYYNAAQNSHYTYHIITNQNRIIVSTEFYKQISTGDQIVYSVSPIFNEINGYGKGSGHAADMSRHSMRYFSGLILPFMVIAVMIIGMRFKSKISILSFVFQALLVADFIYLIQ